MPFLSDNGYLSALVLHKNKVNEGENRPEITKRLTAGKNGNMSILELSDLQTLMVSDFFHGRFLLPFRPNCIGKEALLRYGLG